MGIPYNTDWVIQQYKILIPIPLIIVIIHHALFVQQIIIMYTYYVTGFWKTDWDVTLGSFHFIIPANSYIHTLPMHSDITMQA